MVCPSQLVVAAVDELVVDDEMALLVALAVGVDLAEHRVPVQVQPAVAALVDDPRRDLRSRRCVGHPEALAAGSLAGGPRRPAEGGPTVLAAPRERLVGVPRGAERADGVEVPVVLRGVVVVVRGAHVGRLLRRSRGHRRAEQGHRERRPSARHPRHGRLARRMPPMGRHLLNLQACVAGARKVISSVLFSSPEEAASGGEEEDGEEGNGLSSDENEDARATHGAIVSYSESKLAIEGMVMKETFSRDECDKMVKLIQSRVADSMFPEACDYGTPKEIPSRNAGVGHDFTGAWRSLSHNRNLPESFPFSSIGSGSFSPGSPLQASPELCNAAVMEAKKWLEEKRQGLGSKPEDHGPCTLNTDMLNSGFESDMGSPVDLAKSYMQSLPPWQSPLLGSKKFKTPPSGGVHIYGDEVKSKYSLSSSKVTTKEDYLSNFWENLEESRRARMGSVGNSPDASKFRHYGSTSRLFDNDTSILSSGTHEKVGEPVENIKGSDKVAAAEPANGCSLPVAPTKDGNDGVVDPVDTAKKDNGSLVQECHAATEVHPDEVAQGNHMSTTSVTKDAADHTGDVKAPAAEPEIHEESHMNSASELRAKDAGPQTQTNLNGPTNKASANGLLDQSNAKSGLESSGNENPSFTNSSSAVPPASNERIESTADAAGGDSVQNGTRTKSEEPEQGAPKPSYVRRGRKRVVRGTRGRGK